MAIRHKIGRLFRIETRFEAWVMIYAIALGAVERGQHYLAQYPGFAGWTLAAACTGVVFLAGAKLLDSVTPAHAGAGGPGLASQCRPELNRNRPRASRPRRGSGSRVLRRIGSLAATRPRARPAALPEDRTRSPDC